MPTSKKSWFSWNAFLWAADFVINLVPGDKYHLRPIGRALIKAAARWKGVSWNK